MPVKSFTVGVALAGLLAAVVQVGDAQAQQQARISVGTTATAPPVRDTVTGANHRWPKGGLGMWDAGADAPSPDILDLSMRTKLGLVRYPGGTVANLFDFRKAIGDQDDRGCQVGGGFVGGAQPYDSVYGPDEHQRYVERIGARTEVMVSSVLPVEHAADFVEYMNAPAGTNPRGGVAWADVRAENGHREPYGVHWWEVGNELYLPNQMYWRSPDLDERVRQYAFGGKQRQVDQPLGTACDHRESAGVSDGTAAQRFQVWYPPVAPEPVSLRVGGETWRRTPRLEDAGPDAKVYALDARTGAVRFGDGEHGSIPPKGAELRVDYTSGPHGGFVDYYEAMKEVDPTIEVCTTWEKTEWVELMGREHPYDCVGPHLYAHPTGGTPAQVHDQLVTQAPGVLDELDALDAAFDETFGDGRRPRLEVSEYGAIAARGAEMPEGSGGSVSRMLYDSQLVAGMIERGVPVAVNSNLNRDVPTAGEVFGGAPDFHLTARARMLRLYADLVGSAPVRTEVAGNPDATGGAYAALEVLAVRAPDGTVRVVVLNRDRDKDAVARIDVGGLTGKVPMKVSTLNGPDVGSYNTPEDEDVVHTTVTDETVHPSGFQHRFPAHSMVVLELGSQAASGGNAIGSR